MSSRITIFAIFAIVPIFMSGCSTSSKVDKFLAEADKQIEAKQQIEASTSLSGIAAEQQANRVDPLDSIGGASQNETVSGQWYYKEYSQTAFESALGAGQKVVLFFHAGRCPSCVALEKDISTNPSRIPGDTAILKIDYDSSTELKSKYNVKEQNTIVVINSDGTESKRANGWLYRIEDVLSYL
jgi:hypothetical protein